MTAHGVESGWDNPKYGLVARYILKRGFRRGTTRAHCVTAVARHLQDKIQSQFGVTALLTPSGVNEQQALPPKLIREKYGLNGADYLLFLGRIDPIKRVDWLIDLAVTLPPSVKIVIAGGPQDSTSADYLHRLRLKCSDGRSCIFTGPVTGQEKAELLSNCMAFITPSKNEGLPVSLMEALSIGKCCIASDIEGHQEVIRNGVTGFLFDQGNKDEFFMTVKKVLDLPASESETDWGCRQK